MRKQIITLLCVALATIAACAVTLKPAHIAALKHVSFAYDATTYTSDVAKQYLGKTYEIAKISTDATDSTKVTMQNFFFSSATNTSSGTANYATGSLQFLNIMATMYQGAPVIIVDQTGNYLSGTVAVEETGTRNDSTIYSVTATFPDKVLRSVRGTVMASGVTMTLTGEYAEKPGSSPEPDPNPTDTGITSLDDVVNWTGTGSNRAALVIQWNEDDEEGALTFGYRFDGTTTGWDMMQAIAQNNPRLKVASSTSGYGAYITGIGWDVNNDGTVETSGSTDWYQEGFKVTGYWGLFWKNSIADASWTYSNVGISGLKVTDGMLVGWNWGTGTVTWKPLVSAPSNVNPTGIDASTAAAKSVASTVYYNLAGMKSTQPFSGVNIVVTTYTDGSKTTVKQLMR